MHQPPNSQTTKSASNWVFRCTDASIANRQISLLAILEVFIAMCLFGALAYHSPWPWFSLLACMSAPALLLRCPSSVRRGRAMLWCYWQEKKLNKTQILFIFLVFFLIALPLNMAMTNLWSIPHSGLGLLYRGSLTCVVQSAVLGTFLGRFTFSRVIQIVRTTASQIWVAIFTGFGIATFLNVDAVDAVLIVASRVIIYPSVAGHYSKPAS